MLLSAGIGSGEVNWIIAYRRPTTVHNGIFYKATSYQWSIQDFPEVEGRSWGCQLIISNVILPKTAWKWKNSDRRLPIPTILSSQYFTTFYESEYGNMKIVEPWCMDPFPPPPSPGSVKRDNCLSVVKYPTGKTHRALINCIQISSDDSFVARQTHLCHVAAVCHMLSWLHNFTRQPIFFKTKRFANQDFYRHIAYLIFQPKATSGEKNWCLFHSLKTESIILIRSDQVQILRFHLFNRYCLHNPLFGSRTTDSRHHD